jgi:energy-coupling factor transporter transmembrane protein EcfT
MVRILQFGEHMKQLRTHEQTRHTQHVKMGSDKAFGFTFAAVFVVITFLTKSPFFLILSLVFAAVSFYASHALAPLNKMWFKFGMLLHKIISPIIMGAVFVLAIIPTALIIKLLNKDLLHLNPDKNANTYWHLRNKNEPTSESFKNQF